MPRFFVSAHAVSGDRLCITGTDARHLARSLRARVGELIIVVDGTGTEYGARLVVVHPQGVDAVIEWRRPATGGARTHVHVVQALAQTGMDEAVDALAQAGAHAVWPVVTHRTVSRADPAHLGGRVQRWRTIAREASALAGRAAPLEVHGVRDLTSALNCLPRPATLITLSPTAAAPMAAYDPGAADTVHLVIGPEGGLDEDERLALSSHGGEERHLGPRVLRTRLAGAIATTAVLSVAGDLAVGVAGAPLRPAGGT